MDIRIDQPIGYDFFFDTGIGAEMIAQQLEQAGGEDVTVWVNSPGGDVITASAIYTALRAYKGNVTVQVEGLAASAASVICMAADKLLMSPAAYMMIHRASTMTAGNAGDMEEAQKQLHAIDEGIVDVYHARTHLSRNKIREMMEAETFINATEAVRLGFADGLMFSEASAKTPAPVPAAAAASVRLFSNRYHRMIDHDGVKPEPAAPAAPAPAPAQAANPDNTAATPVDTSALHARVQLLTLLSSMSCD